MGEIIFKGSISFSLAEDANRTLLKETLGSSEESFREVRVELTDVNITLPAQAGKVSAGKVSDVTGFFYVLNDGYLGSFEGKIDLSVADHLNASGQTALKLNTTGEAFNGVLNSKELNLPEGPYFSASLSKTKFNLLKTEVEAAILEVVLSLSLIHI